MWQWIKPSPRNLRIWQVGMLVAFFAFWHVMTVPGLVPHFLFAKENDAAFFLGEPLKIFARIWQWFVVAWCRTSCSPRRTTPPSFSASR